jgi:hypothetical protein
VFSTNLGFKYGTSHVNSSPLTYLLRFKVRSNLWGRRGSASRTSGGREKRGGGGDDGIGNGGGRLGERELRERGEEES